GATGYKVYRRTGFSGEAVLVANWPAGRATYPDQSGNWWYMLLDASAALRPGAEYSYTVRAHNQAGELGPPSDEVNVVVLEPFSVYLSHPANGAQVDPTVTLAWEKTGLTPLPGYPYSSEERRVG